MCLLDAFIILGGISLGLLGYLSVKKYKQGKEKSNTSPHEIQSQDSFETK